MWAQAKTTKANLRGRIMSELSPAEYEVITKRHYQDSDIAERYRAEYAGPFQLRSIPARVVAMRERGIIHGAITDMVNAEPARVRKVLDLPCGTGKLASVLGGFPFKIVAADISREMMDAAAGDYMALSQFLGFIQADASATRFEDKEFDLVVCLRLLHRVPDNVRIAILAELCRITRKSFILSVGLTGGIQTLRQRARYLTTGVSTVPYPVTRRVFTKQMLDAGLKPRIWVPVLPLISSEWVVIGERSN